jgi:hypothetical protein
MAGRDFRGPGAVEILIAVGDKDAIALHGLEAS